MDRNMAHRHEALLGDPCQHCVADQPAESWWEFIGTFAVLAISVVAVALLFVVR